MSQCWYCKFLVICRVLSGSFRAGCWNGCSGVLLFSMERLKRWMFVTTSVITSLETSTSRYGYIFFYFMWLWKFETGICTLGHTVVQSGLIRRGLTRHCTGTLYKLGMWQIPNPTESDTFSEIRRIVKIRSCWIPNFCFVPTLQDWLTVYWLMEIAVVVFSLLFRKQSQWF